MSYKQTLFKIANPVPQSVASYLVVLSPFRPVISVLAEATSYPAVKMGEVAIPFKGRNVYRPTVPEIDGVWKVSISESILQLVKRELMLSASTPLNINLHSVLVLPLGLNAMPLPGIKLIDVWMKGVDQVNLSYAAATEVWKWNVTFRYAMLEEQTSSSKAIEMLNLLE